MRNLKLDLLGLKGNPSPSLLPLICHFVLFVLGQISCAKLLLGLGGNPQPLVALLDNLIAQLTLPGDVHHELGRTKRQIWIFINSPSVHSLAIGLLKVSNNVALDPIVHDV